MNLFLIIPTYHPTPQLLTVVQSAKEKGFKHILVVDDGNPAHDQHYFREVKNLGCVVLHHPDNQGKGAALKTAFRYLQTVPQSIDGVITLDADGQHRMEDVLNIQAAMIQHPTSLILGSRTFAKKTIPWRSRFGNQVTQLVFSLLSGVRVSDTQTGLRGIPWTFIPSLLKIPYQRYEYEMMMLMLATQKKVLIHEVKIATIYHQDHAISSFKPLQDSMRIYLALLKQPLRFLFVAITSFIFDVILFHFLSLTLSSVTWYPIVIATVLARFTSGIYNYSMNRWFTFASHKTFQQSFPLYGVLFLVIMGLSAFTVQLLTLVLPFTPWMIKIGVDMMLFIFSFFIQKRWVFSYEN